MHLLQVFPLEVGVRERGQLNCDQTLERASIVAQLANDLQCGRRGFDPGLGRPPREGKGYPLQYSGLENSMDSIVYGVTKSWT